MVPCRQSIPKGDWFCTACRPKEKPKSPKKKRRAFHAEEPESEDEAQEDEREEAEEAAAEEDAEDEEPPPASSKRSSRGGTKRASGGAAGGSSKKATPGSRKTREASPQANGGGAAAKKRRAGSDAHAAAADERLDRTALGGLLDELKRQPAAEYFLKPVRAKDAPGYYQIVRHPMDLATMQKKLSSGAYSSNAEFSADAGLIFSNCLMYNDSKAQISR